MLAVSASPEICVFCNFLQLISKDVAKTSQHGKMSHSRGSDQFLWNGLYYVSVFLFLHILSRRKHNGLCFFLI